MYVLSGPNALIYYKQITKIEFNKGYSTILIVVIILSILFFVLFLLLFY